MKDVINYLIRFLLREENSSLHNNVVYGLPREKGNAHTVYITPSGFFDDPTYMTPDSLPQKPLAECDGVPVLYGGGEVHLIDDYLVMDADIIASTFFLVSRYEEYVRHEIRDNHGRFIGHQSFAYKYGFLDRPIVEDYAMLLRKCLLKVGVDVKPPKAGFNHIYMTHDIDMPWTFSNTFYDTVIDLAKDIVAISVGRNRKTHLDRLKTITRLQKDPVDTFDWLLSKDNEIKNLYGDKFSALYFLMTCPRGKYDRGYITNIRRTQLLLKKLQAGDVDFGLHVSYRAGEKTEFIKDEQDRYHKIMGTYARSSRHHYLTCREPKDMYALIQAGITDDFSMCYADGGGYRLGTCRPIHWIDPVAMEVTSLLLHPLLATEGKLCGLEHMGMTKDETLQWFRKQFSRIYRENGEVIVLFHNSSFTPQALYPYKEIYVGMLNILKEKEYYDTCYNL